ncbi:MAG: EF-hand domain-containing protein, partial [Planctomycetota bacterium]
MPTRCLLLLALIAAAATGVTATTPGAAPPDFLDQVFEKLDRDGNQQLSREEFRSVFEAMHQAQPGPEAKPRPEGARSKAEFIEYAASRLGEDDQAMLKRFA